MPTAVLVRRSGRVFFVDPDSGRSEGWPSDGSIVGPGAPILGERLRADLSRFLGGGSGGGLLLLADPAMEGSLTAAGAPHRAATLTELRLARERLPEVPLPEERAYLLEFARRRLSEALESPEESLIALAREEERLERVLTREEGAIDQWIAPETGPLREYALESDSFRTLVRAHHDRLANRLDEAAVSTVPNLSAIVGPRVAARLVAAAGSLAALGRMTASRLQLLGSRRRPAAGRGPKYGIIARTVHLAEVSAGREGAYARSLAALAAIAVRADSTTRAYIARGLLERRDRRLARLRQGPVR